MPLFRKNFTARSLGPQRSTRRWPVARGAGIGTVQCTAGIPGRERGAVLVVALIFLVLITVLALSASSGSMLQLRMAGNLRNAQQAQMSADTALRGAEWRLWGRAIHQTFMNCTRILSSANADGCVQYLPKNIGTYGPTGTVTKFRQSREWVATGIEYKGPGDGTDYTSSSRVTAQLSENPRYLVERLGEVRPPGDGPQTESAPGAAGGGSIELYLYRITARGAGGGKNSTRVLQSTFSAPIGIQ